MVTETKFASASSSAADRRERQRCVKEAYSKGLSSGVDVREVDVGVEVPVKGAKVSASTTTGGWGYNSGETFLNASQKCGGSQQDLSIFDSNQFKQTVITSIGSPPLSNRDEWYKQVKDLRIKDSFQLFTLR